MERIDLDLNNIPAVSVVTAHGRQRLLGEPCERLIDLMQRYRIPWSGVAVYVVQDAGGPARLTPCLDKRLHELAGADQVLIYFNRNVNPFLFAPDPLRVVDAQPDGDEATEYIYQSLNNDQGTTATYLKKLSSDECKEVIAARAHEMVRAHLEPGAEIVVGVSGGGDSNALLYGLTTFDEFELRIHPVIAKGIPEWDAGVPRAEALCETYSLELTVLEEVELQSMLGLEPDESQPLINRFEATFPRDDFEFFGTLLIRLALSAHADTLGIRYICTGLNLEDVLAEGLFRLTQGRRPAPIPVRTIGEKKLIFPLWMCPKRIIDGCFPRYSLNNYDARFPCLSLGRNLHYSVAYAVQSQFPAVVEQFVLGLSELGSRDPVQYRYHEELGFHLEGAVPEELVKRFHSML